MDILKKSWKKSLALCSGLALLYAGYLYKDNIINSIFEKIAYQTQIICERRKKAQRPNRIIFVRHGESEANINKQLYATTPDSQIGLTKKGTIQAKLIGKKLKALIQDEKVIFYVSPFKRSQETFENIKESFSQNDITIKEDPRIREQEWGNYQKWILNKEKKNLTYDERDEVGKFYYRFENGESGADVYDRVSLFYDTLYREMDSVNQKKMQKPRNFVIVCHGITQKILFMRYFKLTVKQFEEMKNPSNCEAWILTRNDDNGLYIHAGTLLPEADQVKQLLNPK